MKLIGAKDDVGGERTSNSSHGTSPSKAQTSHLSRVHFSNVHIKQSPKTREDKSIQDKTNCLSNQKSISVIIILENGEKGEEEAQDRS